MDDTKLLKAIDFALNFSQYIWFAILIIFSGITTWLVKRRVKRKMEHLLHRKPEDQELISISSWMNAMRAEEGATRSEGRNQED
jgi:hypothetical protein